MEYWPIKTFCADGVSVDLTAPGTKNELYQDLDFNKVFDDLGIFISEKKEKHFHDILLEFK